MSSAIELKKISVIRGSVEILKKISLKITKGKTTIFIGPSGCGKSTLLKIAAGIMIPDEGEVVINEKNLDSMNNKEYSEFRKSNGFIFQDAALWANKSVYQNLYLPLKHHMPHLSDNEIDRRIGNIISKTGYTDESNLRPHQLSSGERKIISFARALITDPVLIFMDSPSMSVDYSIADKMNKIIMDLKQEGKTLIIVTHNPGLISLIADYIVVLKEGELIEAGSFKDVLNTTNKTTISILSKVLDEASSYDDDILKMLNPEEEI